MPRPMTRWFVEGWSPVLDIRQLVRERGKDALGDRIGVNAGARRVVVSLERVPRPPLGGVRVYFRCPRCDRRCDLIYGDRTRVACRKCLGLAYWSTALGPLHRSTHARAKARERLGQRPGLGLVASFPEKPLGMHWRTYERLAAEAEAAEARHWSAPLPKRLARLIGR